MKFVPLVVLSLTVLGCVALMPAAFAQSDTATANAAAVIVGDLTLTNTSELHFGDLAANAAGTATIAPDGTRTVTGGTVAIFAGSTPVAAEFDVEGLDSEAYAITLPASATLTHELGVITMVVDTFTSSHTGNVGVLDPDGLDTFTVGATLHVDADQAGGDYTGTFDVSVAYN